MILLFPLDDHQKGAEVKVSLPNGKEKRIPEVTFRKHYTHVYKKLLSLPTGIFLMNCVLGFS